MQNLIAAVRAHALANFEKDGWDILVECWEDSQIAETIGGARTEKAAIAKVRKALKDVDEYRQDIRATAW